MLVNQNLSIKHLSSLLYKICVRLNCVRFPYCLYILYASASCDFLQCGSYIFLFLFFTILLKIEACRMKYIPYMLCNMCLYQIVCMYSLLRLLPKMTTQMFLLVRKSQINKFLGFLRNRNSSNIWSANLKKKLCPLICGFAIGGTYLRISHLYMLHMYTKLMTFFHRK
jgi:hypothetical protein